MQIGLKGEEIGLSNGGSSLWVSQPALPKNQPLIWYKVNIAYLNVSLKVFMIIKGSIVRLIQ